MMPTGTTVRSAWIWVFFIAVCLMVIVPSASLAQPSEVRPVTAPSALYYTVQRGDTLAQIAQRFYRDFRRWKALYAANRDVVQVPQELEIGWVLRIPNPIVIPPLAVLSPARERVAPVPVLPPAVEIALTFATSAVIPPFAHPDWPQRGMLTEVVESVFKSMKRDIHVEFYSPQEALQMAQSGGVWGLFPVGQEPERADLFFASKPLYRVLVQAFVHRRREVRFETLADLHGLTVCQPDGYASRELQSMARQGRLTLQTAPTTANCFEALDREEVDIVAVNELSGPSVLQTLGMTDRICRLDNAIGVDTLHVLFSKVAPQSRVLAYEFDHMLSRLERDGTVKAITTRHLQQHYEALGTSVAMCQTAPAAVAQATVAVREPPRGAEPAPAAPSPGPVAPNPVVSTTASPLPATPPKSVASVRQVALSPVAPTRPLSGREWASIVPLSPPRRQLDEFLERVPPERPPKQLELVSVRVAEPPSIDGRADELVWQTAPAITTLEAASQRQITLQSVHTAEQIFFLVSYPDQAPSETHESWGWDAEKEVYKAMGDREDAFVFKWSLMGNQVNLALSNAEPHRADVWFWQAFRTNHAGYADDQMHLLLPVSHEEATLVNSLTHGPLYLHRMADVGQAAYKERLMTAYQADYLPRYYPNQPSGSRADVQAKGQWHDRTWTIEFGRQMRTPNDDDLSFAAGEVYLFGVSCYEMASGRVEPQLTQPLYYSGDVFDRLLLRIARGDEG